MTTPALNWNRSYRIVFGTPNVSDADYFKSGTISPSITASSNQNIPSNAITISNLATEGRAIRGFNFSLSSKRKLASKSKNTEKTTVTLLNLSPDMVSLLHKKHCLIQISAGYNENVSVIYKGYVVDVLVSRTATDVAYSIICKDTGVDIVKAKSTVSIPEKYNAQQALKMLAKLYPSVTSVTIYGSDLSSKYSSGGWSIDGKVSAEMDKMCKKYGMEYAIQNGQMVIMPKTLTQGSKDSIRLVKNNYTFTEDIIKSVTKTKSTKKASAVPQYKNVTVRTYLVPFSFSQVFTLPTSDYYDVSGTYRPKVISYDLNSRGNAWDVIIEGTPL